MEGVEIMPEWSGQGSAHSEVREGEWESSGGGGVRLGNRLVGSWLLGTKPLSTVSALLSSYVALMLVHMVLSNTAFTARSVGC